MNISKEQQEKLSGIQKGHNIKLAMVIGSRTEKGNPKEDSDLDIAFILNRPERKYSYIYGELFSDLSEVFQEYNIDIVNIKNTDFLFRYEVYLNSELIIGDEMNYLEFKARAFREYVENKDLLKLSDIILKKKLNLLKQ